MAGRAPESLLGAHLVDLVEPQDAERVGAALRSAREAGSSLLEISLVRAGRSGTRPVSVHLETLPSGTLALMYDVTEKARMLDMVRREKELSRSLIETVNACVLGVDLKGRVTLLNRRFRETAGVAPSEALAHDAIEMLVAEQDRPAARRALQEIIAGRGVEDLDLTVASGRVLSFSGALVEGGDNQPRGVVWVAMDVTHTRRRWVSIRRI
jgi:PAS domain S-box-containing protein